MIHDDLSSANVPHQPPAPQGQNENEARSSGLAECDCWTFSLYNNGECVSEYSINLKCLRPTAIQVLLENLSEDLKKSLPGANIAWWVRANKLSDIIKGEGNAINSPSIFLRKDLSSNA